MLMIFQQREDDTCFKKLLSAKKRVCESYYDPVKALRKILLG